MVDDLFDVSAEGAFVIRVQVHPGAGRTSVVGRHGDALKLKVAAPPEQGRANEACSKLLAEIFGVSAGDVELASGGSSLSKRFAIAGVDREEFVQRLELALDDAPLGGGTARSKKGTPGSPRR